MPFNLLGLPILDACHTKLQTWYLLQSGRFPFLWYLGAYIGVDTFPGDYSISTRTHDYLNLPHTNLVNTNSAVTNPRN